MFKVIKIALLFSLSALPALCIAETEGQQGLVKGVQEIQTNCPFDADNNVDFTSCDVDFWSVCGIEPPKVVLQTKGDLDRLVDGFRRKVMERLIQKYPADAGARRALEPTWELVDGATVDGGTVDGETVDEETRDLAEILSDGPQPRFSPEFEAELNEEMEAYLSNFLNVVVPITAWYASYDVEGSEFAYVFFPPTSDSNPDASV